MSTTKEEAPMVPGEGDVGEDVDVGQWAALTRVYQLAVLVPAEVAWAEASEEIAKLVAPLPIWWKRAVLAAFEAELRELAKERLEEMPCGATEE